MNARPARPRSKLTRAAIALVVLSGLLAGAFLLIRPRAPSPRAHDEGNKTSAAGATATRRAGAMPPRLHAQPVDARSARVGADSLAGELDPKNLAEAQAVDAAVRSGAFSAVGLTPAEVTRVEPIYREADRLWLQAERQLDPATGRLLPEGIEGLYAADRHITLGLIKTFTGSRAAAIRNAERRGYREKIRSAYNGEAQAPFSVRLAIRRLDVQRRIVDRPEAPPEVATAK